MALNGQPSISLYSIFTCTFGSKDAQPEEFATTEQMLSHLQKMYKEQGLQRHVEAVILVHRHNHPHVLLLQSGTSSFRLPGGWLRPGEDEAEGLRQRLRDLLSPQAAELITDWHIGDCIASYWRPHFEANTYPYLPVHITRPKECRKLFAVHLPERCYFAVPNNYKLVATPLYDCYEGSSKFGPVIATLPQLLSRYRMTTIDDYTTTNQH